MRRRLLDTCDRRSSKLHLRKRCHHVEVSAYDLKVAAAAIDLLVLLSASLLAIKGALGLTHEIELLLTLGDEGPIRVVLPNRCVDFEPARELHEQLHMLVCVKIGSDASFNL